MRKSNKRLGRKKTFRKKKIGKKTKKAQKTHRTRKQKRNMMRMRGGDKFEQTGNLITLSQLMITDLRFTSDGNNINVINDYFNAIVFTFNNTNNAITELIIKDSMIEQIVGLETLSSVDTITINSCLLKNNITVPNSIKNLTIRYCNDLEEIIIPEDCQLETLTIDSCDKLTQINIPTSLTNITLTGNKMLTKCIGNLTNITVMKIEDNPLMDFDTLRMIIHKNSELNGMTDENAMLDENWVFEKNIDKYKTSPPYLKTYETYNLDTTQNVIVNNPNPYIISYVTYMNYQYPIITIPKGTMLYSYTHVNTSLPQETLKLNEEYLYNLATTNSVEIDKKFFYPVPYASKGVNENGKYYNYCSIVTLNHDIRLVSLLSPAPQTRVGVRLPEQQPVTRRVGGGGSNNYYNNLVSESCENKYDLCMSPVFLKEANVQGYIGIARNDSIYSGEAWAQILAYDDPERPSTITEKKIDDDTLDEDEADELFNEHADIVEDFILKSCIQANKDNLVEESGIQTNIPVIKALNRKLFKSISDNRVFGIPEICISPIRVEHFFTNFVRPAEEIQDIIEANYNYTKLCPSLPCIGVKDYLDSIAGETLQNKQAPLLHMHAGFKDETYDDDFVFNTPMTAKELGNDPVNYDYEYAYSDPPTGHCSFETVLYGIMKSEEDEDEEEEDEEDDEEDEELEGGAYADTSIDIRVLPEKNNNKLELLKSKSSAPAPGPAPTPKILVETISKPPLPEVKVSEKMTPVLKMSKSKIPILFWK